MVLKFYLHLRKEKSVTCISLQFPTLNRVDACAMDSFPFQLKKSLVFSSWLNVLNRKNFQSQMQLFQAQHTAGLRIS